MLARKIAEKVVDYLMESLALLNEKSAQEVRERAVRHYASIIAKELEPQESVKVVANEVWDQIRGAYHWGDGFTDAARRLEEALHDQRNKIPIEAVEELENRGYQIRFLLRELTRLGIPMPEGYTFHNGDTYYPLPEGKPSRPAEEE